MGINQANKPNEIICRIHTQTSYLPVGFAIVLKKKNNKKIPARKWN